MPSAINIAPATIPTSEIERPGHAIISTPSAISSADAMMQPVFATRTALVERIVFPSQTVKFGGAHMRPSSMLTV